MLQSKFEHSSKLFSTTTRKHIVVKSLKKENIFVLEWLGQPCLEIAIADPNLAKPFSLLLVLHNPNNADHQYI